MTVTLNGMQNVDWGSVITNYKCFNKFNVGALIRPSKENNRCNVIRLYVCVYTCAEQQIRGHRGLSGFTIL